MDRTMGTSSLLSAGTEGICNLYDLAVEGGVKKPSAESKNKFNEGVRVISPLYARNQWLGRLGRGEKRG